jgi:hypothetical protein
MDQILDGVAFNLFVPAIDVPFKVLARQDGAGADQQRLQKRELPGRQAARAFIEVDLVRGWIETQCLSGDNLIDMNRL